MYTTYSTDAVVFSRAGVGEGDLVLELFTRDFGIVRAKATGARDEKSKLRYALQTLSLTKVALVSGKRGWRLTGAELVTRLRYRSDSHDRELCHDTSRVARIVLLLRTLMVAEAASEAVFDLFAAHAYAVDTDNAELAFVAAVLSLQGYVHADAPEVYAYWCREAEKSRVTVLAVVNNALSANHIAQK